MRTTLLMVGLGILAAAIPSLTAQESNQKPFLKGQNKIPTATDIRKSIERGLPYLETEGVGWMKERKCMSCHVVPFMVWAFNEAHTSGVKVDEKKLAEWTVWCVNDSLKQRNWFKLTEPKIDPKAAKTDPPKSDPLPEALQAKLKPILGKGFVTEKELLAELAKILTRDEMREHQALLVKRAALPRTGGQNDGGSTESIGQMLLGRLEIPPGLNIFGDPMDRHRQGPALLMGSHARLSTAETMNSSHAKMVQLQVAGPEVILKWQEANGSWKAAGQLPSQNRPKNESSEVTTAWTLLALGNLDNPNAEVKLLETGLAFFRQTKPGKSHESLLMHMLIERRFGKPGAAEPFLKEVLARQNADGGWSWLSGGSSDAFATGQSLYALNLAGLKSNTGPIVRAQRYLLDTQSAEGIWEVPPQAVSDAKDKGRLRRLVPIYHFWGTAWAVIGLSRSLEVARSGEIRRE